MIAIDNRSAFVQVPKKAKWKPLYCPRQRWGYLVEQKGSKVVICLSTGEQIIEASKYWSGVGITRKD